VDDLSAVLTGLDFPGARMDLLYLALIIGFTAVSVGLVYGLERLKERP
jgi:hypothetical protein